MTRSYTIWPLRFSPQPEAVIAFFADLGLHKALDHADGTFATFTGRSGKLGVHSSLDTASTVVPGHTALNFAVDDVVAAAAELSAAGLTVSTWDETYGKQGIVSGPGGLVIGLNGDSQDDLYGGYAVYDHASSQTVAASMDVQAIFFTDEIEAAASIFEVFGFTATAPLNPYWNALRAHGTEGMIALHHALPVGALPEVRPAGSEWGPPLTVALGFETSEPLDALASRLQAAGYDARTVDGDGGVHVEVVDPDGEGIQIHLTS